MLFILASTVFLLILYVQTCNEIES
ncbi:MAG: hypothetical protein JJP05_01085 [cyanobacterium endosymbiont of Rhopalodia gibba]